MEQIINQAYIGLKYYFELMGGEYDNFWNELVGQRIVNPNNEIGFITDVKNRNFWIKYENPEIGSEPIIYWKKVKKEDFIIEIPVKNKEHINLILNEKIIEKEKVEQIKINDEFFRLIRKYSISYTQDLIDPTLFEILKKLENGTTFYRNEVKWLFRNKFYNVVALFYENKYFTTHGLHDAKNAFRFWYKANNSIESEKWADLLLLETLKLENEILGKIRFNFRTINNNYDEYLSSVRWKMTRIVAIKRAHGKCQVCDSTENLNVHHRKYDIGNEKVEDLTVLCRECHSLFHENKKARLFNDLKQN